MSRPAPFDPACPHPRLLVSVRDADEAAAAALAGADLVDAKDPALGALGALGPETVRAVAARVGGRALTSAVAGEPAGAEALAGAVAAMAGTGVDFVKVALPPDLRTDDAVLSRAASAAPGRLIAVLFAEDPAAPNLVARLAAAGFAGAMIDTAVKDGRRLTDLAGPAGLAAFAAACRAHGLLSGLAGSLALADIPVLAGLGAHYLGLRSGLCHGSDRTRGLDPERVAGAAQLLRSARPKAAA